MATNVTSQERTNILKLVAGMFNAAPGATYLEEFSSAFLALNKDYGALATALGNTGPFKALYPSSLTVEETATKFLTTLGLAANTEAQDFVQAKLNAGESIASVIFQSLVALVESTSTDPEIVAAQALLANKATVAEYYSVTLGASSDQLATLHGIVANVTADPASVEAAKEAAAGSNGQTFTLTTGADDIHGTAGNDKINGSDETLTVFDAIDGGAGTDTLNLVFVEAKDNVVGLQVNNVENVVIKAAAEVGEDEAAFDMSGWNGVKTVAITGAGSEAAINVKSAASDSVTVSAKGFVALTDKTVAAIAVNTTGDNNGVDVTAGNANVTVATTGENADVSITAADAGAVSVTVAESLVELTADSADSVSVTGAASVDLTVDDLGAVTLKSAVDKNSTPADATDDTLVQIGATITTVANTALDLTLNGADVILSVTDSDADAVETDADLTKLNLNVAAAALGNKLDLASDTITDIAITGAGNLDLTVDTTVVTDINASAATGNISVTIDGDVTSYAGGAGVDTVTLNYLPIEAFDADEKATGKFATVIDGGAGTADVLKMDAVIAEAAADLTKWVKGKEVVTDAFTNAVKGFEVLSLTNVDDEAVDATTFGISHVKLAGEADGFTLTIANEGTVEYTTGAYDSTIVVAGAAEAVADDAAAAADFSLNLVLAGGVDGIDAGFITVDNVGALTLASNGKAVDVEGEMVVIAENVVSLEADAATHLTITGNAALDLSGSLLTALETVDAGSFDAGLTIDLMSVAREEGNTGVSITTGAGDDVIYGSDFNDTIVAGAGNNTIAGGAGADAITIGSGINTLVYGSAADSTGLAVDVITGFNANDLDPTDAKAFNTFDLTALLSNFDFGSVQFLGSVANATLANTALQGSVEMPATDLQVIYVTGENTLYADANGNGTIDAGDLAIQLVGLVGNLSHDNFVGSAA